MSVVIDGTSGVAFPDGTTRAVGTSANNLVALNGSAQLPAVDGSLLTGITTGKWEYISSGAVNSSSNLNFTSIPTYTQIITIITAQGSNTGGGSLRVYLSSNNGSSYGSARTISGIIPNSGGGGTVTISNTGSSGTSKVIQPYFSYENTKIYTTSATESSITGVINALRFNFSDVNNSCVVTLFGVP